MDVDALLAGGRWTDVSSFDGSVSRILAARSGEIRAGNFYELSGAGMPGDPDFVAKLWWVPKDPDIARTVDLTVTVASASEPSREPITLQFGPASSGPVFFWPSGIPLPSHGRWQLTAEAAGHWGCFLLTV